MKNRRSIFKLIAGAACAAAVAGETQFEANRAQVDWESADAYLRGVFINPKYWEIRYRMERVIYLNIKGTTYFQGEGDFRRFNTKWADIHSLNEDHFVYEDGQHVPLENTI